MPNESSVLVRMKLLGAAAMRRDARVASKELSGIGRAASGVSRRGRELGVASRAAGAGLGVMARAARWGGVALGAGLVVELRRTYTAFAEVERVNAASNAVLRSTGGVAKVSAKDVEQLATAVSRYSGQDDEAVQASENLLLTFTKVRREGKGVNDIFGRATRTSADLAQTFHKDLNSSAIMVGKALNDPIKGVTSLSRAGVQFTAAQKEEIKTLVESGRTLDAQKLILAELETQVGGSARAYGKTLPGSMDRAKVSIGNVEESIGRGLAPAMQAGASAVDAFVQHSQPAIDKLADGLAATWRRPGLTPEMRLKASWDAIEKTGFPDAAKEAIYQGISEVGTRAPVVLIKALSEAPWPAKGVIAAIFLAKFGPALKLLGKPIGKALGGGAAGRLGGKAGAVPVWVVNGGAAGAGGLPGKAGKLGKFAPLLGLGSFSATTGGIAVPGLEGAALGAGGLGAGAFLAGGAALIAGGIGLDKLDQKFHFMSGDPEEARRNAERNVAALIDGYRNGEKDLGDQLKKLSLGDGLFTTPEGLKKIQTSAESSVQAFTKAITAGGPKVKHSTVELTTSALQGLSGLPPLSKTLAADAMVRMARELEDKGRLPKGATQELMRVLTAEIGKLPAPTALAAGRAASSFGELQMTLRTISQNARDLRRDLADIPEAPGISRDRAAVNAAHASGGMVTTPWSLVGERGPELARLPIGSRVYPHGRSRQMMAARPMAAPGPLFAHLVVNLDGKTVHSGVYRVERQKDELA